jgi:small multidrug resistance pump
MGWTYLLIAILGEWIGTSALKAAKGFTVFWPSLIVTIGYGVTFYFFSLALKTIPYTVAYAIWSGLGIILITISAFILYGQKLDAPAYIGAALIMGGVFVINFFSRAAAG